MLGIQWELDRHTLGITEIQKLQHLLPSPSPKKKRLGLSGACWLISLAARNFYAYLWSLLFLA
jgi:hypothetical protein